jgi:hypothetical protein
MHAQTILTCRDGFPIRFPRLLGRKSESGSRCLELVAEKLIQVRDKLETRCLELVRRKLLQFEIRDVSSFSRGSRCNGIWPKHRYTAHSNRLARDCLFHGHKIQTLLRRPLHVSRVAMRHHLSGFRIFNFSDLHP